MIERATAIPLAIYPYSSTSHIVHWLTRHHGKISTLIKGALRPKNRFLGEYELFSTTELLYFVKPNSTLYTAKECSLLQRRPTFRTDWRAMQSASYLTALFNKTTPEEAPEPALFDFFEEMLDQAQTGGSHPQFMLWAELRFCNHHGHSPQLNRCTLCSAEKSLRFCAAQGGVVCEACATKQKLPTLECAPDVLAILRAWQNATRNNRMINIKLNGRQKTSLHALVGSFMLEQFKLPPQLRSAALATPSYL